MPQNAMCIGHAYRRFFRVDSSSCPPFTPGHGHQFVDSCLIRPERLLHPEYSRVIAQCMNAGFVVVIPELAPARLRRGSQIAVSGLFLCRLGSRVMWQTLATRKLASSFNSGTTWQV